MKNLTLLILIVLLFLTQTVVFYFSYIDTPFWYDGYFILERIMLVLMFSFIYTQLPDRLSKNKIQILGLNIKEIVLFSTIIAIGRLTWVILRTLGYTTPVNEKLSYFFILIGIGIFACFIARKYFITRK